MKRDTRQIGIMGTVYTMRWATEKDEPRLTGHNACCDGWAKENLFDIDSLTPAPTSCHNFGAIEKSIMRHELIHAFLTESGLDYQSVTPADGWAVNEEMVDWFARQWPKIQAVFREVGCL